MEENDVNNILDDPAKVDVALCQIVLAIALILIILGAILGQVVE